MPRYKPHRVRLVVTKKVVLCLELEAASPVNAIDRAKARYAETMRAGRGLGDIEGVVGTEDHGWALSTKRKGPDAHSAEPADD